ncbi:hypothetical protein NST62_11560 [Ureibacillus sp. FSL K6-8385]|uniref:hypothetical protein n=1 Tax=Ureibacillus TaxID=160795 RepID=UPI0015EF36BD|nr:hypothetical protein [Ureibacillus terrenus]MED3662873.1 hypothetical protein [Ureibacillus terrenus]MED3763857.1 hypothetical protein [Ureibacillus terrenus]
MGDVSDNVSRMNEAINDLVQSKATDIVALAKQIKAAQSLSSMEEELKSAVSAFKYQ